jgi:putative ABC transport system substrate-binding protein
VILPYPESDPQSQARTAAFQRSLEELGWADGQNIRVFYRWGGSNVELAHTHAAELIAQNPDVIIGNSTPVAVALLKETRTIPIIFVSVSDPIGSGLVSSFAHPGGNVTGFTNVEPSMGGKWVELLKEIAPHTRRFGFIFNPQTAPTDIELYLQSIRSAAISLGIGWIVAPVHSPADIEAALARLGQEVDSGVVVMLDVYVTAQRKLIMELTTRYKLPAVWPVPFFGEEGGLISYGADIADLYRRAATYIDRILKGEKPGELPVQGPVKFGLIINLRVAKALGLTIPQSLLARADEVIE